MRSAALARFRLALALRGSAIFRSTVGIALALRGSAIWGGQLLCGEDGFSYNYQSGETTIGKKNWLGGTIFVKKIGPRGLNSGGSNFM